LQESIPERLYPRINVAIREDDFSFGILCQEFIDEKDAGYVFNRLHDWVNSSFLRVLAVKEGTRTSYFLKILSKSSPVQRLPFPLNFASKASCHN
jgi:hypothetical protein